MRNKKNVKKVLHLISSIGFFGAENVIIELSKALINTDYFPIIGAVVNTEKPDLRGSEIIDIAKKYNIETIIFSCKGKFQGSLLAQIRGFIKKNNVHVLNCHGYKADFLGILSFLNIPKIATHHPWLKTTKALTLYSYIDAFFLNFFDRIIVVAEKTVKEVEAFTINRKKIVKINNGVDLERFDSLCETLAVKKEDFGFSNIDIIIGMVSSLKAVKGHTYVLQAMEEVVKRNKNVKLLIVGDGPDAAVLR